MKMVVGEEYIVDGILCKLADFREGDDNFNSWAYFECVNEDDDFSSEMWFGKTDYYSVEGWHDIDDLRADPNEVGFIMTKV